MPCQPSPCGPNSECREINDHAVCSCKQNYIGSPPSCRPECIVSSECAQDKACLNMRCVNPCQSSTCGENARCQVLNHNPICSCSTGYTGDPFFRCLPEPESKSFFISLYFLCAENLGNVKKRIHIQLFQQFFQQIFFLSIFCL